MEWLIFLGYGIVTVVVWFDAVVFYRLYLHPLAGVPGPKHAAISRSSEWYHDCIRSGQFWREIQRWHQIYGPIVRIAPNEVHIDDPEWFNVLYNSNSKLDKDPWYYGLLGTNQPAFATAEHDLHRMKRNRQNPFFSRQSVDKSASVVTSVVSRVLDQFETYRQNDKSVNIKYAMKSYTADVVCEYCFSCSMDFVTSSDFSQSFQDGRDSFSPMCAWFRHFPGLARLVRGIPDWVIRYLDEQAQLAMSFVQFTEVQAREAIDQSTNKRTSEKTLIQVLYESDLPLEYRTESALADECTVLVGAGISTVATAISTGIYHILANPSISERLTKEVRAYKPETEGTLTQRDLENLPYLSAIVLEILRISPAIRSRLPRINKTQDMIYETHHLPKGTIISMGVADVLLNDKLWGNAHQFDPSRWLDPVNKSKMQKYLVAFGRGSRSCLGQNLAVAEIYTMLGNLFRRFDAELFDTGPREVEIIHDYFDAQPAKDTVGVRVMLK